MRHGVVIGREHAERAVAYARQVDLGDDVAGRHQLDAVGLEAVVDIGLEEAESRRARRQEAEDGVGAGRLDPLHDRAEVGGVHRDADRLDHGAAIGLESLLERRFGIDARTVVTDRDRRLARAVLVGDVGRRHGVLPHRERGADDVGALLDDRGGSGVQHHQRRLGFFQQRRHRHRVRREIDAGEILHLVLDDQLLRQRLGFGGVRTFLVAVDELDGVIADLVAVLGDIGVDAHFVVGAEQRVGAGHRSDHADLDDVGGGGAGHQRQDGERQDRFRGAMHVGRPRCERENFVSKQYSGKPIQ